MSLPEGIRLLVEALGEPALIIERGRVVVANGAARANLGRSIDGADIRLAIRHPQALDPLLGGNPGDYEITGIGEFGRPWILSVRSIGGDLLFVRLIDRAAAVAAEKMRVDFVANASHELRTPLSVILGYAETLAEDRDLDTETRLKFGNIIRNESQRMVRLVQDLMSLSRIEADRFVPPSDEVSIEEVVGIAAGYGEELAARGGCAITVEVEPDIPRIRGDLAQLTQMLENLVSNAVRYGCPAEGCTVRLEARRAGGDIMITVADDGEGIASEHLPRLTERFYRADAARSRASGGTGLGLAIVKHIVERHKGRLEIRSVFGQGTQVIVQLPVS